MDTYLTPYPKKNNSKWKKDLNIKAKSIIFLEEIMGNIFQDNSLGNYFFAMILKEQTTEERKISQLHKKNASKDIIVRVKMQTSEWENIFTNHLHQ